MMSSQKNVANALNPLVTNAQGTGFFNLGGTPFSPQYMPFNAPGLAVCANAAIVSLYGAKSARRRDLHKLPPGPLDNISYRLEYFDDLEGQRTGTKTALFRDRYRLAALALAADRNPPGGYLL